MPLTTLRSLFTRFSSLFRRSHLERELHAELDSHLQLHVDDNLRRGLSPEEARRQALLQLGGLEQTKESVRAQRSLPSFESLFRYFRHATRTLRKSRGFAVLAILTLALGIGATTAIFTVVYATLIAPLPYPNSDQLVMVWSTVNGGRNVVSAGDFLEWQRQSSIFQGLIAMTGGRFSLAISGRPEMARARITSPGFFDLQGIPMHLGRDFLPEEATRGKDHVVILTNRYWRDRFGGDPNILGTQLRLNGEPYTVVGVVAPGMPDRFESPLFLPLAFKPDQINHDFHWLVLLGRLQPGVTIQQANAGLDSVTRHLAELYPSSNKGWGASVQPLKNDFTSPEVIKSLWLLLAAVGFVLLIACVNVANLLLARGTTRYREVAVRASLGASPRQLFSQFLAESLTLSLIGGAFGIALAWALLKVIIVLLPQYSIPTEADVRLSWPVLLFAFSISLAAAILAGCVPAWRSSRADPNDALKEGGRSSSSSRHGLRRALVIVEFALALTLLDAAGLVIHSFWKLTRADLGFRQDHLLTFTLPLPADRFTTPEQLVAFYRQTLERIRAVPGVSAASASTGGPMMGFYNGMPFTIVGQPSGDRASRPDAGFLIATPDYFQTYGLSLASGRTFTDQDLPGSPPVALVNETFVKRHLPNLDPLKQRLSVDQLIPGATQLGPPIEWQIIGVVRDARASSARNSDTSEIIVPMAQSPSPRAVFAARATGDPASLTSAIAAAVNSVDPDLPLDRVRTMDQIVDDSLANDRFATGLFAAFAVLALILAAIGIYGVMSFAVAQRTHEIGLRMALGAAPRQVLQLVLREGMLLAFAGLFLGLAGTYAVGRAMRSLLYQVGTFDPLAVCLVSAILVFAAITASYLPARRASRVDPMISLRYE